MSVYSQLVFPWIVDHVMAKPDLVELRSQLIRQATGDCLEIGFGTGLNLSHYPKEIRSLAVLDSNPGMLRRAKKRLASTPFPCTTHLLSAEKLPFEDGRFNTVVSTWTLCSVKPVESALKEIRRVMKPDGRFIFLEHGLSRQAGVARWQRRLNGLNGFLADGCQITRDFKKLLRDAGFVLEPIEEFYQRGTPKTHAYMYRGIAKIQ